MEVTADATGEEDGAPAEASKQGKAGKKGKGKEKATAEAAAKPKHPPLVSAAAIVGGMSAQKQKRILSRGVDVLVATPGRLWDIIQEVSTWNAYLTAMTAAQMHCRMTSWRHNLSICASLSSTKPTA